MSDVRVYQGDSRELIKALPDNSVDAVVTDGPYALASIQERYAGQRAAAKGAMAARITAGFMGRAWDTGEAYFSMAFWADVLRVVKPGGHVFAFCATRTYHRLAVVAEDAGFDIWDMVAWLFATGVPLRSKDLVKALEAFYGEGAPEALAWEGWGTALKPAMEPIMVARKPLLGTIARNVEAYGCGGLNIDGCRVPVTEADAREVGREITRANAGEGVVAFHQGAPQVGVTVVRADGRWPANVVHDGSAEVVTALPETSSGTIEPHHQRHGATTDQVYGAFKSASIVSHGDSGSAARFFYSAKADAEDRLGSDHPTVKPVDLMRWLVRLATPPGGVVLDPFAGTGTTGMAALAEGVDAILIEREADHADDIRRRLAWARGEGGLTQQEELRAKLRRDPAKARGAGTPLFGGGDE